MRKVSDIEPDEKRLYEAVLGQKLKANQQIIIQVMTLADDSAKQPQTAPTTETAKEPSGALPDWCNVYEGLTETEITEVEDVILNRADMTRPSP